MDGLLVFWYLWWNSDNFQHAFITNLEKRTLAKEDKGFKILQTDNENAKISYVLHIQWNTGIINRGYLKGPDF